MYYSYVDTPTFELRPGGLEPVFVRVQKEKYETDRRRKSYSNRLIFNVVPGAAGNYSLVVFLRKYCIGTDATYVLFFF